MQLIKVELNCDHAKTILSAKDFENYPLNPDPNTDIILVCLKCKQWTPVEFK